MTDTAEVVDFTARLAAKAEYQRRVTACHKRRLLKLIKETELPPFPGGIDDLPLGE